MADDEPILPRDADILDRNDEVNLIMERFAENYTRRRVVDTMLAIIIAIVLATAVIVVISNYHFDQHLLQIEQRETQLECSQIPNSHTYVICAHVQPPKRIGVTQ